MIKNLLYKNYYIYLFCEDKGHSTMPFMINPHTFQDNNGNLIDRIRMTLIWDLTFNLYVNWHDVLKFKLYAVKFNGKGPRETLAKLIKHKNKHIPIIEFKHIVKHPASNYDNTNFDKFGISFWSKCVYDIEKCKKYNKDYFISNPTIIMNKQFLDQLLTL